MDKKMMEHLCSLSKLSLNKAEEQEMIQELNRIIDYMQIIRNGNSNSGQEPEPQIVNVFREDRLSEWEDRAGLLLGAPEIENDQLVVPLTVSEEATE